MGFYPAGVDAPGAARGLDESVILEVWIPGIPRPQGSMKIINSARTGKAFGRYGDKMVEHRNAAVMHIRGAWGSKPPITGPVSVTGFFYFDRPKHHYGTGRNSETLRQAAPAHTTTSADLDKLARLAMGDALVIAGVLKDDSLVTELFARKAYTHEGIRPGTYLQVTELRSSGEASWALRQALRAVAGEPS